MFTRKLLLLATAILLYTATIAQVTTSGISGVVKDEQGKVLNRATILLTHVPTGTVYSSVTRNDGSFDIANINPGGPYHLEISYTGFDKTTLDNIMIGLGETLQQDIVMQQKDSR